MNSRGGSVAPHHGKCQTGRWVTFMGKIVACPNRAEPGKSYCATCHAAALARLPDRAIGDRRGTRLGYGSVMSRSWE